MANTRFDKQTEDKKKNKQTLLHISPVWHRNPRNYLKKQVIMLSLSEISFLQLDTSYQLHLH